MMEYVYATILILATFYFYAANSFKLNPFLARRSIIKYNKEKVVSEQLIIDGIKAAILAPNHFLTEPWRFYICGDETINKIIDLNKEKEKQFRNIPNWMVVTMNSKNVPGSKLFLEENHIDKTTRIIDLSQDFRNDNFFIKTKRKFIYGLPEMNKSSVIEKLSLA